MSSEPVISLTPGAARKVVALLEKQGKPQGWLRLRVSSGGCSGLNLEYQLTDEKGADDKVYESNGARLLVDPKSEFFLFGSVVDYESSLMKSGFVIKNPNATSTCGCGTSFSV
ncbi:MAG: iron-sulfur cluster assembly accessory protein [Elusimicrobia bacterium]|nr:iron-sulfur cluster assembly accessory protein [Elusimicrobiota bacterium]